MSIRDDLDRRERDEGKSKLVRIVRMMLRDGGATVNDMAEACDCHPRHVRHCVRIARELFGSQLHRAGERYELRAALLTGSRVRAIKREVA